MAPLTSLKIHPLKLKADSLRVGFYRICAGLVLLFASGVHAEQRLYIGVDPRIELLTAVQLLSGYRYLTPYRMDYARDLIAYFSRYPPQQAVAFFRGLSWDSGWSDAYPTAMLYLSYPPELAVIQPIPPHIYRAFHGEKNFSRFVLALRHFARQTQFGHFFARSQKLYSLLRERLREKLAGADPTGEVEAYFGTRQISYHLVLSPLLHHGGFGPHLGPPKGPYEVYTLLGPTEAAHGLPGYGPRDQLLQIIWHEFSHAFVNPLSGEYYPMLRPHADLFAPLAEQMASIGYAHWFDCANEHLIRAVTARLAHHHLGAEAGRRALHEEAGRGFRYIHALAGRLEEYEAQRDRYPTFAAFFPRLIAVFAEITPQTSAH